MGHSPPATFNGRRLKVEVLGNKSKSAVYLSGCAHGRGEGEGGVLEDWLLGVQLLETPHKVASRSQAIPAASN